MMEMKNDPFLQQLYRRIEFAHLLCMAYGQPAFAHLGSVVELPNKSLLALGGWVGPPFEGESLAPFAAQAKVAELFHYGQTEGLSLTPVEGFQRGLGWMGGARLGDKIVGVSKWDQRHDRLLALLILYSFKHGVELHHAGFRHGGERLAREAAARAAGDYGTEVMEVPAGDHLRLYVRRTVGEESPRGHLYEEHQWFPDNEEPGFHWDVVTPEPHALLGFIAHAYDSEPVWLEPGQNGPFGVVWVEGMGVMARPTWWSIEG